MLYYLADMLEPWFGALNVLTYQTVRAGGAAVTGFLLCLLFGPALIRRLRELKIGQYIKKDHVADLHALHKGKAGTPTMGGVMIIGGTLAALLLWGRLTNRLLWLSMLVILLLGTVGFIDDFIKLRRRHNDGLSARAKFIGQILTGLMLGVYLYFNPITVSASTVYPRDIIDWSGLESALTKAAASPQMTPQKKIWDTFPPEVKEILSDAVGKGVTAERDRLAVIQGLNTALRGRYLYDPRFWPDDMKNRELESLCQRGADTLSSRDIVRMNRLLIEAALPGAVAASEPDLHTKVGVPGFKNLFIPLGIFYILFVVVLMVSISNAVNLTDGLDGLAAGVGVISILTYAGIAYIVSRADWSHYLFLTYVPEASELFVFGAALLGTGLGFLWFNGHPAEVFMGDTGSLALGGAIGALALLTKQELLLPVVAGIFVLEAASVVIQVASFKMTGKRVFRMAPLHHHFELLGWVETKVTMRFWIVALVFALLSLATLKLR
jgi:phospho-N-acetylmuramoyl-pentapeptide-transferase